VVDSAERDRFVELVRARLASGAGYDEVLGLLRQHGLHKGECIIVMHAATGLKGSTVKMLVHRSPVWADRRALDEAVEDMVFRVFFIASVVGEGHITGPAEDVAECRERQQRARTQMRDIAADLPDEALTRYHEFMAENLFGRAFAALVTVEQQRGAGDPSWRALAAVAETLCLNELLDDEEPGPRADDYVQAAYVVRRLIG
jgi:hypothetical protein